MRTSLTVFALAGISAAFASAGVPKKQPLSRYSELWTNSPITNPEVKMIDKTPPPNPLDDYTLASLCQIKRGWHVILLHKKERSKRIRLTSYEISESRFSIVSVENPATRQARVKIDADGQKGWVKFEPKFLSLKKSPAPGARQRQVKPSPASRRGRKVLARPSPK